MELSDFDDYLRENDYDAVHTGRLGDHFIQRDSNPSGPAGVRVFVRDGDDFRLVAEKMHSSKYSAMGNDRDPDDDTYKALCRGRIQPFIEANRV